MQNNQLMAAMPLSDVEKMAVAIAKSGLFGVKTPDQALALMLVSQAEGMHPASAAKDYHIIQGRPCLKADAMLARFQASGGSVRWNCYNDQKVEAVLTHPQGGTVTVDWTIERAKNAGLTGKDTWRQYPRQMLRARVLSEGIRTVFPAVCSGTYTPEEVADFDAEPPRNITPAVEPEKPKKATQKSKPEQTPQDAEIVQPDPVSAPEKVEPAANSAADVAAKIKKARALFAAQGIKSLEDFRAAILNILGREVEGLTALNAAELDQVIANLEGRTNG